MPFKKNNGNVIGTIKEQHGDVDDLIYGDVDQYEVVSER